MSDFDKAFERVIGVEGGYVNDPRDPGGETIYGITKRDHPDLWVDGPPSLDAAKARYKSQYWDKVRGDDLPWPINVLVFDAAVNQGAGPAIVMLQKALRVAQDGILGRQTLSAVAKADLADLTPRYMAHRALRYYGTRNFDRFGEGWLWRLFHLAFDL